MQNLCPGMKYVVKATIGSFKGREQPPFSADVNGSCVAHSVVISSDDVIAALNHDPDSLGDFWQWYEVTLIPSFVPDSSNVTIRIYNVDTSLKAGLAIEAIKVERAIALYD